VESPVFIIVHRHFPAHWRTATALKRGEAVAGVEAAIPGDGFQACLRAKKWQSGLGIVLQVRFGEESYARFRPEDAHSKCFTSIQRIFSNWTLTSKDFQDDRRNCVSDQYSGAQRGGGSGAGR